MSLTTLRSRLPARRDIRVLLVVTALGLLAGVTTGDKLHAHDDDGVGHTHPHVMATGHASQPAMQADVEAPSAHFHDSAAPALICALGAQGHGHTVLIGAWGSDVGVSAPPSSDLGPPHRPPIA